MIHATPSKPAQSTPLSGKYGIAAFVLLSSVFLIRIANLFATETSLRLLKFDATELASCSAPPGFRTYLIRY